MKAVYSRRGWILLAILALALAVRLATVRFGLPALNDPDEMMFEMGAIRMLSGPTLNPGWFGHPATTTIYLLAIIDILVFAIGYLSGRFASPAAFAETVYADPSWVLLPGRIAMVLFAIGTIWLTYRLANRLFGARAGLIAALLLAINPIHVTWSQIIRSDMMACFFMLLCLQASCAVAERGRWRDYVAAALWLGVAIATKWPFALVALAIAGASLHAVRTGRLDSRRALFRLAASGLLAIGFLLLVSPYLVIDHTTVAQNLRGEGQAHHLGATGQGFWSNLWWYLRGPFLTGFTLPGMGLIAWGMIRLPERKEASAIIVPVAIGFLLLLCLQHLIWERWALPLMPLGAIIAGWGMEQLHDSLGRRISVRVQIGVLAGLVVLMGGIMGLRIWSDGRMRLNDTRQLASAWARRHIPPGSTVLIEHFAFDILSQPWRFRFPMGDAGCVDVRAMLQGKIDYATIAHARGDRSNVDYGTIPDSKRSTCRADFAILTQFDRYRQERTIFAHEYGAYRTLSNKSIIVSTFTPDASLIGGPVVVIMKEDK